MIRATYKGNDGVEVDIETFGVRMNCARLEVRGLLYDDNTQTVDLTIDEARLLVSTLEGAADMALQMQGEEE